MARETVAGTVLAILRGDTSPLGPDLKKGDKTFRDAAKRWGRSLATGIRTATRNVARVAATITAGFTGASVIIGRTAVGIENLNRAALNLGTGIREIQVLERAAERLGIPFERAEQRVADFYERLQDAASTGGQLAREALQVLGGNVEEALRLGGIRGVQYIQDLLNNPNLTATERLFSVGELAGNDPDIQALFQRGNFGAARRDLAGFFLSDQSGPAAKALITQFRDLRSVVRDLTRQFVDGLLPVLNKAIPDLTKDLRSADLAKSLRQLGENTGNAAVALSHMIRNVELLNKIFAKITGNNDSGSSSLTTDIPPRPTRPQPREFRWYDAFTPDSFQFLAGAGRAAGPDTKRAGLGVLKMLGLDFSSPGAAAFSILTLYPALRVGGLARGVIRTGFGSKLGKKAIRKVGNKIGHDATVDLGTNVAIGTGVAAAFTTQKLLQKTILDPIKDIAKEYVAAYQNARAEFRNRERPIGPVSLLRNRADDGFVGPPAPPGKNRTTSDFDAQEVRNRLNQQFRNINQQLVGPDAFVSQFQGQRNEIADLRNEIDLLEQSGEKIGLTADDFKKFNQELDNTSRSIDKTEITHWVRSLEDANDTLRGTTDPLRQYKILLSQMRDEMNKSPEAWIRMRGAVKDLESAIKVAAVRSTEEWQIFESAGIAAIDTFVETGKFKIKDFVRDMLKELAKLYLRRFLFDGIFGGTGIFPGLAASTGISAGQGRAIGGPVKAGQMYRVGEHNRPEMFVPDRNGTVLSHRQIEGMGGPNVYIDARNLETLSEARAEQLRAEIIRDISELNASGGAWSKN